LAHAAAVEAEKRLPVPAKDMDWEDECHYLQKQASKGGIDLTSEAAVWNQVSVNNKSWHWHFSELGPSIYSRCDDLLGKNTVTDKLLRQLKLVEGRDYFQGLSSFLKCAHGQLRARGHSIVELNRQSTRALAARGGAPLSDSSPSSDEERLAEAVTDFKLNKNAPYRACHGRDDVAVEYDTERLLPSGPGGESPAIGHLHATTPHASRGLAGGATAKETRGRGMPTTAARTATRSQSSSLTQSHSQPHRSRWVHEKKTSCTLCRDTET
jgi:hypothetical protein